MAKRREESRSSSTEVLVTTDYVSKHCIEKTQIIAQDLKLFAKDTNGNSVADRIDSPNIKYILVVGQPSSGKSTLLKQLSTQQRATKTVLWWDLSRNGHNTVNSVQQLVSLPRPEHLRGALPRRGLAEELKRNGGKDVLLFIDHFNKLSSFLSQLLTKSILPQCLIIAAAQYRHVEALVAKVPNYVLFEMKGVKTDEVYEAIVMKGREIKLKSTDRIADYIRAYPELQQMCRHPAVVEQVLEIFQTDNYQCPKTVTSLLKAIVDAKVAKARREGRLAPQIIDEYLEYIYHLAFVSMEYEQFTQYEFSCVCAKLGISGSGAQLGNIGLMQILVEKDCISCKFIHRTIQAYLAALYIRSKPIFEQAYLTLKFSNKIMSDDQYSLLLAYFCGTAHTHLTYASSLNIAKVTLYPLLESLADKLSLEESTNPKTLLMFLRCLYEAQDPSIVRKFLSRRQKLLTIPLQDEEQRVLAEPKLLMVSYCVAHSGINSWVIKSAPENQFLMDYFKMLITDQLSSDNKSQFRVEIIEGFSNQLLPAEPNETPSTKSKSNVYSRIARELFHRLMQLHSPIKLKSDGSSTSYISLLGCACLQKLMEAQRVLKIEPLTSSHWLPMKSKAKKPTAQQDENQQTLLHMRQKHDNEHVEFVLMMLPYPHRLRFITPGTAGVEIVIELCTDNSPDFLQSGIGENLHLPLLNSIFQETHFNAINSKMVVPDLPLPKQTHSRALTVAPDIPEPPRDFNREHRASDSHDLNDMAIPVADSTVHPLHESTERRQGQPFVQSRPIGAYDSTITFHGLRFEPTEQQSHVQRPLSMRPGVVVHTKIPQIFATDQQYPLPDETHLIRKGGNGEIFSVVFGGRELVVKKTSYRNREFLIHSKLQHQNIVPLLCLMMGEKHPSQRRKVICYHFLPRANGDLARLAVDNEQNTLKQLKLDHGTNPKQFGLILGNLKYLLTQILQGLVYLHGQSIVHRDLKASNILLTFHCLCLNPLTCPCAKKCDVQIADFDSAIQLTADELLPASKTIDRNTKTFTVVPVGTMGYRPPESGQLMISNDVGIISPQVTTKSDMWSFGVLMMKMLNGNYGPSSQRELSTLLLYYNEERWRRDKPPPPRRRVIVTSYDVTKILKLSKLREDMYWNPRAVDCVKQCLQIDPESRKSAQDHLQHPFLY